MKRYLRYIGLFVTTLFGSASAQVVDDHPTTLTTYVLYPERLPPVIRVDTNDGLVDGPIVLLWRNGVIEWKEGVENWGARLSPPIDWDAFWRGEGTLGDSPEEARKKLTYYGGTVPEEVVTQFLADFAAQGFFEDQGNSYQAPVGRYWWRPYNWVTIIGEEKKVSLLSSHELAEADPNRFRGAGQFYDLDGSYTREELLALQPTDYQRFRAAWSFVKVRLNEMIAIASSDATTPPNLAVRLEEYYFDIPEVDVP